MIYTINTATNVMFPVIKSVFKLSDEEVYRMINNEHSKLLDKLQKKGINYSELKRALIPNQKKENNEVCLVFDTMQIKEDFYGNEVFDKLLPLMYKDSTYSVLIGDYIDILREVKDSQKMLFQNLKESIELVNETIFRYSNQYFIVYINSITDGQLSSIIGGLKEYKAFTGYAFLRTDSKFKSYLSCILSDLCVKNKNTVICSHPSDIDDNTNINQKGYHFEENGFRLKSINEDYYGTFLSYKIETILPDPEDVSFSFNALFPRFDSMEKLTLDIPEGKWGYFNDEEKGKGKILHTIGFDYQKKREFSKMVFKKICGNYIYNINKNEYGDLMFDVCIELATVNGNIRRTTIGLKYHPDTDNISLVTIT